MRVEVEFEESARSYGLSGTCTKVDDKAKELVLVSNNEAVTVPCEEVEVRSPVFLRLHVSREHQEYLHDA